VHPSCGRIVLFESFEEVFSVNIWCDVFYERTKPQTLVTFVAFVSESLGFAVDIPALFLLVGIRVAAEGTAHVEQIIVFASELFNAAGDEVCVLEVNV
jgi:hypothetical protein